MQRTPYVYSQAPDGCTLPEAAAALPIKLVASCGKLSSRRTAWPLTLGPIRKSPSTENNFARTVRTSAFISSTAIKPSLTHAAPYRGDRVEQAPKTGNHLHPGYNCWQVCAQPCKRLRQCRQRACRRLLRRARLKSRKRYENRELSAHIRSR